MKKLILLAFVIITNVFAGEMQERFCDDKSLSYCINHFDRQCKAKNYFACQIVGALNDEQEQYSEAKKYFEMVCDNANSKGSYELEFIDGRVMKIPATIFMETMRVSCNRLGNFYYNGEGVRQSYEKALQYWKKACGLGSGELCAFVGFAYYKGEDIKKDLKSSIKFAAKSCDLEYSVGCYFLGLMYSNGEGVKQNLPKAKELYGKACDLGFQNGCDEYKKFKEKGY